MRCRLGALSWRRNRHGIAFVTRSLLKRSFFLAFFLTNDWSLHILPSPSSSLVLPKQGASRRAFRASFRAAWPVAGRLGGDPETA